MVAPLAILGATQVTVREPAPGVITLMIGDPGPPAQNGRPSWLRSLFATPAMPAGMHPVNWFPLRNSSSRLVKVPSSAGIVPVNWFPHRYSPSRLVEGAQPCRNRPGQLVVTEGQLLQAVRLQLCRIGPVNWSGCPGWLSTPTESGRSTGFPTGTALPGWSGCPALPESGRLTGSPTGTALPGWSGCPALPGSGRSTGSG